MSLDPFLHFVVSLMYINIGIHVDLSPSLFALAILLRKALLTEINENLPAFLFKLFMI